MGKKSNSDLRGTTGQKETDRMLKKLRTELCCDGNGWESTSAHMPNGYNNRKRRNY